VWMNSMPYCEDRVYIVWQLGLCLRPTLIKSRVSEDLNVKSRTKSEFAIISCKTEVCFEKQMNRFEELYLQ
jgi:hypothetical protein